AAGVNLRRRQVFFQVLRLAFERDPQETGIQVQVYPPRVRPNRSARMIGTIALGHNAVDAPEAIDYIVISLLVADIFEQSLSLPFQHLILLRFERRAMTFRSVIDDARRIVRPEPRRQVSLAPVVSHKSAPMAGSSKAR